MFQRKCLLQKKVYFSGKKDGMFLIRDSIHGGADSPFTLTLYFDGKVYNINIRIKSDGHIALGKKKPGELVSQS